MDSNFPLQEYYVAFKSEPEVAFQIFNRADTSEPAHTVCLLDNPVEMVVDYVEDTISFVPLMYPYNADTVKRIEINESANFGFDSIGMGGVGISDLRDGLRRTFWFDMRKCRLSFQVLESAKMFQQMEIVAEALNQEPEDAYLIERIRRNPTMPT